MKNKFVLAALISSAFIASHTHAANISRSVDILPSQVKTASLKIQFSGGCTGSATLKNDISLRFNQSFQTDSSDMLIGNSLRQVLTATQTKYTRSNANDDRVLFSTGRFVYDNYPSDLPLNVSDETYSESIKKDIATLTYTNKSPDVLIRQFNYYLENLSGGPAGDLANIKKCLADYSQLGIDTAHEVTHPYILTTRYDTYLVNSAKKTNIKTKLMFEKANSGYYTQAKAVDFKAVMGGVLIPEAGMKCSGKVNNFPVKSTCKALAPIKYKITMVMKGDIL